MDEDNGLFPVIDMPDYEEEEKDYEVGYKPSLAWDLQKGDFTRTNAYNLTLGDGMEAYKAWCVKMACTERFSCLAYDGDIGVEMEEALAQEDENAVEMAVERTIEEALMVNPRTESVEDFEFQWNADSLHVKFSVTAVGWESFMVEVDLDI